MVKRNDDNFVLLWYMVQRLCFGYMVQPVFGEWSYGDLDNRIPSAINGIHTGRCYGNGTT